MTEKKIDEAQINTDGCKTALDELTRSQFNHLTTMMVEYPERLSGVSPSTRVSDPLVDSEKLVADAEKAVTSRCGASPAEIVKHNYQKIKGPQ